jgi:hypothetical protein
LSERSERSPDGAKRNPGFPHSATLHAGYTLALIGATLANPPRAHGAGGPTPNIVAKTSQNKMG